MSATSGRILFSMLLVCVMTTVMVHGQILTRRQQFNLLRQQKQLVGQQDVMERQSSFQDEQQQEEAVNEAPVSRATFERLFEAVRAINELLQTLSAIRARFNSDSSQLASFTNIPTFVNNQ